MRRISGSSECIVGSGNSIAHTPGGGESRGVAAYFPEGISVSLFRGALSPKNMLPPKRDEMRNALVITGKLWLAMIMLIAPALAQNRLETASPAMTGPAYDFSTGYTYLAMPIPGAGQVRLNGFDASGSIAWNPHWGATLDTNYLFTSDVPGTGHEAYMLNTQIGPEFSPLGFRHTRFFIRALAGSALIDGAVPVKDGLYHGWLVRPSLAFGGGWEQSVSRRLAIRLNGDYLRTLFYDPNGEVLPQNNLRLSVSLVVRTRRTAEKVETTW